MVMVPSKNARGFSPAGLVERLAMTDLLILAAGRISLFAQATEQIHYRTLGRINKAALGYLCGSVKQFFGFGHVGIPVVDAASLNGVAFSGIHFHFKGVEAA